MEKQAKKYFVQKEGWSVKTITNYISNLIRDPSGGVKQVEVEGSLQILDKDPENGEVERIVFSNP